MKNFRLTPTILALLSVLPMISLDCSMDVEMGHDNTGTIFAENTGPESITDVIVLTGQSNALATHSRWEQDNSADDSHTAVYAYNADKGWQIASLDQNWYRYWPIGWERPTRNNAALHAAKAIVNKDPSRVVGIILAAEGDRSIDLWDQGEEMDGKLDAHVRKALEGIPASKVDGVIWMQGEADGSRSDYGEKLGEMISRMRKKNWGSSQMSFVCSETKGNRSVNRFLMALNDDGDSKTGCVEASDQTTDDRIHFDTPSIRTIGARQGLRYLELLDDKGGVVGPDAGIPEPVEPDAGVTPKPVEPDAGVPLDAATEVDLCDFDKFFC